MDARRATEHATPTELMIELRNRGPGPPRKGKLHQNNTRSLLALSFVPCSLFCVEVNCGSRYIDPAAHPARGATARSPQRPLCCTLDQQGQQLGNCWAECLTPHVALGLGLMPVDFARQSCISTRPMLMM